MIIRRLEEGGVDGVVSIFNDIVLYEDSFINEEPIRDFPDSRQPTTIADLF